MREVAEMVLERGEARDHLAADPEARNRVRNALLSLRKEVQDGLAKRTQRRLLRLVQCRQIRVNLLLGQGVSFGHAQSGGRACSLGRGPQASLRSRSGRSGRVRASLRTTTLRRTQGTTTYRRGGAGRGRRRAGGGAAVRHS